MKWVLSLFVLLFCQLSLAEFQILSLNTYGPAYATGLRERTQNLLEHIRNENKSDIYLFQEAWKSRHIEDLEKGLGAIFGEIYAFHANEPYQGYSTGLLTASKFQILEAESLIFKEYSNGVADWFRGSIGVVKALGATKINIVDNGLQSPVWVLNTHLHHSSQSIRIAQIVELGEYLNQNEIKNYPLILAGDFNFLPDSLEKLLLEVYGNVQDSHLEIKESHSSEDVTYDANNPYSWGGPSRTLDYVFFRQTEEDRSVSLKVSNSKIYPKTYKGQYLSDHYGRTVQFKFTDSGFTSPVPWTRKEVKDILIKSIKILSSENPREFEWAIRKLEQRLALVE